MDTPFPSLLDLAAGARPLDWLWPGWIPRGALTLLAASPGAGKSLVALDLRGSSHIAALARSILALGEAPACGASPVRRLEVIKSNLCALPPPLGLVFEGSGAGAPALRYTGPWVPPPPPPTQLELAAAWLVEILAAAGEPLRPRDLVQAAEEAGFARRTLYRARGELGPRILDLGAPLHDPTRRWTLAPTDPSTP